MRAYLAHLESPALAARTGSLTLSASSSSAAGRLRSAARPRRISIRTYSYWLPANNALAPSRSCALTAAWKWLPASSHRDIAVASRASRRRGTGTVLSVAVRLVRGVGAVGVEGTHLWLLFFNDSGHRAE